MDEYIILYDKNTGRKLGGYTVDGTFQSELQATLELLAYENRIEISDIEITKEVK